jgi:Protein of unknown function (DUF2911)
MNLARISLPALAVAGGALGTPLFGQDASFVVMLGKDTVAVEQYTRSATRMTGELISRLGAAGNRLQYEVVLAADGRPLTVIYRARPLVGTPAPGAAREVRLTFAGDSVKREAVFADSTNVRILPAVRGVPFQYPAFGLLEVAFSQLRRSQVPSVAMASVGTGGGTPGTITFTVGAGDTIRAASGGGVVTIYRADREGKLLSVDASGTTQKVMATRGAGKGDLEAIAARMTPFGTLSPRGVAFASFLQSVVFVNYGRPQVRGRSVWGGLLVPPDTIWRLGANEATHLATSRELTFESVTVPPGLYTLWLFNAASGPQLVINKQVGQWGTSYDQAQDLGRIPVQLSPTPEHVEEFTITLRNLEPRRGAIEFAWGSQMATAMFTVR